VIARADQPKGVERLVVALIAPVDQARLRKRQARSLIAVSDQHHK